MPCILVVEDDSDVQGVVSEFLRAAGYHVLSAASPGQARALLARGQVDLALIDCLMRGEQGISLAEHVSALGIPAILTSGDPHYLESLGKHSVAFLPKPFRLTVLEELISQQLRAGGTATVK